MVSRISITRFRAFYLSARESIPAVVYVMDSHFRWCDAVLVPCLAGMLDFACVSEIFEDIQETVTFHVTVTFQAWPECWILLIFPTFLRETLETVTLPCNYDILSYTTLLRCYLVHSFTFYV